jgi:arylformamidase
MRDHAQMRLVELSHTVEHGMITYPGLPGPVIGEHMSFDDSADRYDPGTEFTIGRISMVSNTGTYLDTPGHRFRGAHDLAGLPLQRCALLPAVVVDATSVQAGIDAADLPAEGLAGTAVLLHTGWDRHWRTDHYGDSNHPFLTAAGSAALVQADVALVGIDSVNIDSTTGGARPAHTQLLAAGIPIVEHLTGLEALPARNAIFSAVPAPIRDLFTFPVRAFAQLP